MGGGRGEIGRDVGVAWVRDGQERGVKTTGAWHRGTTEGRGASGGAVATQPANKQREGHGTQARPHTHMEGHTEARRRAGGEATTYKRGKRGPRTLLRAAAHSLANSGPGFTAGRGEQRRRGEGSGSAWGEGRGNRGVAARGAWHRGATEGRGGRGGATCKHSQQSEGHSTRRNTRTWKGIQQM